MPDVYQLLLNQQLLMQSMLYKQNIEVQDNAKGKASSATVTRATAVNNKNLEKNKENQHTNYKMALDNLLSNDMNETDNDNSDNYSDISSEEEYYDEGGTDNKPEKNEKNEQVNGNKEVSNEKEKEDENVIEMMKEFINSDDKTGPKINDSLAELVNLGLRKRVNGEQVKDIAKKYLILCVYRLTA